MNLVLYSNQFGQVNKSILGEDFDGLEIKHDHCSAKVSLYGGQVLTWQPMNQQAIFWLSDDSVFVNDKAIRGGIPLCWPWFGGFTANKQSASNHGFARQQQWQVASINIEASHVSVVLIWEGVDVHPLWPNACHLKQELCFGKTFSQTLYMTNISDVDCNYTGALHSYFQISDPLNVTVNALSTALYDDKITEKQNNQPYRLDNCIGPIDRIYHSNNVVQLVDKEWQRVIEVEALNTKQWVLWNPGTETAEAVSDIHQHGQQEFVCLEAANTQSQLLKVGETHSMGQVVRVFSL